MNVAANSEAGGDDTGLACRERSSVRASERSSDGRASCTVSSTSNAEVMYQYDIPRLLIRLPKHSECFSRSQNRKLDIDK